MDIREQLQAFPGCPKAHYVPSSWLSLPKCPICLGFACPICDKPQGGAPGDCCIDCLYSARVEVGDI